MKYDIWLPNEGYILFAFGQILNQMHWFLNLNSFSVGGNVLECIGKTEKICPFSLQLILNSKCV